MQGVETLQKTVYAAMERDDVAALVPVTARRILDVGCGAGNLAAALKRRDPSVHVVGVEMSRELAALARPKLDGILIGTLEDHLAELPDGGFDCVVFADVLEHMINPYGVLLDTRPKLVEAGVVVASIPNVRHWSLLRELVVRGRWGYAERGLLDSGHVRFFTRHDIEAMFRWAGYQVEIAHVVGAAPRPLWWANRLMQGRLMPFIAYQYLAVAHPLPGSYEPSETWWARGAVL